MKARSNRTGFSAVEIVIVVVVVGIVGLLGYTFYNSQAKKAANDALQTSSQPKTASDVKTAPAISHVTDLSTAELTVDQTDLSGSSNTDLNQLNAELANF
jgi:prepilin-type N-terminal cleavage/methylation domain-containing protein